MNILTLFASVVLAAETSFSSLVSASVPKPAVSFADLAAVTHLQEEKGAVLGTGTFSASVVAGEAAVKVTRVSKKSSMTIAFLGDSMVDTLGKDLGEVRDGLRSMYPKTAFTLLNYGVGGENIVSGLARVLDAYSYLGKTHPSLISQSPDLIVVESFGYNPFPFETGALEHHWMSLAYIVDALKANIPGAKIVIAATIAPNSRTFGDGAAGLAFSATEKLQRTQTIKSYLENATKFAKSQELPLADAYHSSLDNHGDGRELYVNPGDHIHYSDAGRQFFAKVIVDTITNNKLLEE